MTTSWLPVIAAQRSADGKLTPIQVPETKGPGGNNGWTPVLAGEADGTRTLIKVIDWTGGQGAKPQSGMYLGTAGYVATKAAGFNFNAAKRIMQVSAGPTVAGVVQMSFASLQLTTPPVVVPLPATTAVLSGVTRTVITNITKDGCTATIQQAALLTAIVSLVAGATANVLVIEG